MIEASGFQLISPSEAAIRLAVTPRRVYELVRSRSLRAERIGGRLLLDGADVDARLAAPHEAGRPFSARRAWALILLASGQEPVGLDLPTRSKLRRHLAARDLWSMRSRLGGRAERHEFRAHSSDLARIEAEAGVIRGGVRHASDVGLGLVASDAPVELYVDRRAENWLVMRYRLVATQRPNVILRVVPDEVRKWLHGVVAARAAIALDIAENPDPRSQEVAREALSRP